MVVLAITWRTGSRSSDAHLARLVGRAGGCGSRRSDQDRPRRRDSLVTTSPMTTLTYPATAARRWPRLAGIVPGTLLLAIVGFAGKVTEQSIAAYGKAHHLALPNIEYVLWAIVFGLVVSNTIGIPAIFRPGDETYEFWLKVGIVLLGVRFLLGDVVKLGSVSLVCVALELAVAIVIMTALGRAFR